LRARFAWPFFILLTLLTGCGNGNDGKPLGAKKSAAQANPVNANIAPNLSLAYCKTFTVVSGTNPTYAEIFAGAVACKANAPAPTVRLKVSANFPSSARFCLVPANDTPFRESCFTVNGQTDVLLDSAAQSYGTLVLLAESDLSTYKAFLGLQVTPPGPPRAVLVMNQ
jgi:hypothetical protein